MQKKWIIKPTQDPLVTKRLSSELNINETLSSILLQRNIENYDEAKAFFRPSLDSLHNPFLMKDMDKAVRRLRQALERQEKILVYGDYDVDGTTAVALFFGFISSFYHTIDYYIPDRYTEGYGVSNEGIEYAAENGFSLIVCLDCGIKAVEKISLAASKGVDFIVCDHHRPGNELPAAYAVLDPKRSDCPYPYKELSGCGIGYKFLQAYCIQYQLDQAPLYEFLDLVVVSIASDIVPIMGENRTLAYFGLKQINAKPRPGLKALIEIASVKDEITISKIVFTIGPRINAAGRIEHAKAAVKLLLCNDVASADECARTININNTTRRDHDSSITREALGMIENDELLLNSKSTVLFKNDWHKGVIGIVASRCIEKFYRPTIILTESNNMASGSARSVVGFDVYEAIADCSDLLSQFGGHKYAAGLTMELSNVEEFRRKFEAVVSSKISPDQLEPIVDVDQIITLDQINFKLFKILAQMEPFGPGNMQPVFVSEELSVKGQCKIIKEEHLKFFVQQKGSLNTFSVIAFGCGSFFESINSGKLFKMAYTIEVNEYRGEKSLQLCMKDIIL
ncbi:MAG: single-stranded-DNA-specific exonuclease RecJ [Bacteroidota bacterium]|nr:single-stranded-DNA-specific exonuclease RecJ [Bacteroidota bacterium]